MQVITEKEPLNRIQARDKNYLFISYGFASNAHKFYILGPRSKRLGQFSTNRDDKLHQQWQKAVSKARTVINELKADGSMENLHVFIPSSYKHAMEIARQKKAGDRASPTPEELECKLGDNARNLLEVMGHQGRFKAMMKNISKVRGLAAVGQFITETKKIYDELLELEKRDAVQKLEKQKTMAKHLAHMLADGLTFADLGMAKADVDPTVLQLMKKYKPAKNKEEPEHETYQCHTPEYGLVTWIEGQGPMPQPMRDYMQSHNIDDIRELRL